MKKTLSILALSLLFSCGSPSGSGDGARASRADGPDSPAVDNPLAVPPVGFVAVPGEREFSGRMIARPLQSTSVAAKALAPDELRQRRAAATIELGQVRVVEHVRQTDEYLFDVPKDSDENAIAKRMMATGGFEYVEPDWILFPIGVPNDPLFADQWHHAPNIMDSARGWDLHTGNPTVSVGICDTGILTTHEDFQLHRLEGYNAVDQLWESNGGQIGPVHSHGTQTTGCAAANGNNGKGVSGVGWNLSHRMLRVSNLSTGSASLSTLNHAARTSIENGDRVASVSYSGADSLSNRTTATYIKSIGGLLCWAAGNSNTNLTAGDRDADDLIVVGATTSGDVKASFSSFGIFVDLVAPGASVLTTNSSSNTSYAFVSGTSFSCPLTAGMCAMIWSANPTLTPDQVEAVLKQSADDLGTAGVDNTYGYGRINLNRAMVLAGGGGGGTAPVAAFVGTPTSGTAPLTVQFTDQSSGQPTAWSWSFGDGGTSTAQHPSYIYTTPGTFTVSLTVTNASGSDVATRTDYITVGSGGGGGPTGEGLKLSKNADFSTEDLTFGPADTVHILAWSDRVDHTAMTRSEVELRSGKNKITRILTNLGDNSHSTAVPVSDLGVGSWSVRVRLEDATRQKFQASATITITGTGGAGSRR